jgi:hypothetical protein
MRNQNPLSTVLALMTTFFFGSSLSGQSPQPYPNAVTDRAIHQETPMLPPLMNAVFTDPDFGSQMVRVTDETTNHKHPGRFFRNEGSGRANEWSSDTKKFYAIGAGGTDLAFAFDPATMAVSSLPSASPGDGLLLPLRPGPSFSFVDPDLIYGTADPDPLTIVSYRFSTGVSEPVLDTRTCGVQPPLGTGRTAVSDDDVSLSLNDTRMSISEGGPQFGKHMFVVVYDKNLGCRWYNTQTGQIGGQWGPSGQASVGTSYLIRHAYLARSGKYIQIATDTPTWYVWDLTSLNVTSCTIKSDQDCAGYSVQGYNSLIIGPGVLDDMQVVKRPLGNLSQISSLVYPLPPPPGNWGQPKHFTWSNVNEADSTPVCASTHSYDGDTTIDQPFAAEIFCIETDGLTSTVWRFAHNRAAYIKDYFHTQPLGNVSMDGNFFLFTSDWDAQLGIGSDGSPRSDMFIVKLK